MVETVRPSCIRCAPGPGTRAQQTTSALPTSSAAIRSTISGSSVSTRIALALLDSPRGDHPQELQGTANLILVLEAHATAHSTAPGARLWDGLTRPSEHDVNGRPRLHFHAAPALPDRGDPGLWDGLTRPSEHDVNGRPRLHFHAAPALPDRGDSRLWDTRRADESDAQRGAAS